MKKLSLKKLTIKSENFDLAIVIQTVLMGVMTPLLVEYVPLLKVRLIGVPIILMLINFIYSAVVGILIQKRKSNGTQVFIFPVVFFIMSYLILPKYMFYFGPIYLLISYLSWSMTRRQKD